jgi:hypothetical protein
MCCRVPGGITFTAALRHDKMVIQMVFKGPTRQMFLAYVIASYQP